MVSFCLSPDNYLKSLLIFFSLFSNNTNEIWNSIFSSMYKQVRGHKSHSEKWCLKMTGRKLSLLFIFNSHLDRSSNHVLWKNVVSFRHLPEIMRMHFCCLVICWFWLFVPYMWRCFLVFKKKKIPYKCSVDSTEEICCCLPSIFQNQEVD